MKELDYIAGADDALLEQDFYDSDKAGGKELVQTRAISMRSLCASTKRSRNGRRKCAVPELTSEMDLRWRVSLRRTRAL